MRRRVGREGEFVLFGFNSQRIEYDSRLDSSAVGCGIEFDDGVHVLREVDDDGNVTGLAGDAGSTTAGQDGGAELAAGGDGGDYVGRISRDDQADGNLAVVRRVGGIERAGRVVETNFSANSVLEAAFKFTGGGEVFVRMLRFLMNCKRRCGGHRFEPFEVADVAT